MHFAIGRSNLLAFCDSSGVQVVATLVGYEMCRGIINDEDASGVPHCSCCTAHSRTLKRMLDGLRDAAPEGSC